VTRLASAKTVHCEAVKICAGDTAKIDDARVRKADIPAINGVIHGIDTVLIPGG